MGSAIYNKILAASLLGASVGACSLLVPLFNAEPCVNSFLPVCEGDNLITCESGFTHSTACASSCNPVALACSVCGDSTTDPNETCDDGNTDPGDGCDATCQVEAVCGNAIIEAPTEQCEGADLGGQQCTDLGFTSGSLSCAADCTFDASACVGAGCGNDIIENTEDCDGTALGGQACTDLGFLAGTLDCALDCTFDTSSCVNAICGNNTVEAGEQCDDGCGGNGCNAADNGDGCSSTCQDEPACTPVGHDEDGDTIDDACDNCPTVPNGNQANVLETQAGNTADTVGDACDPRPAAPGDSIGAFDAFAGATLNAAWLNTTGWSVSGDKLRHTDSAANTIIRRTDVNSLNVVVEIHAEIIAIGGAIGNEGPIVGMPDANNGVNCSTEHNDGNGTNTLRLVTVVNNIASTVFDNPSITDPVGRPVVLTMTNTTNTVCTLNGTEATASNNVAPAGGAIGIRSRTVNMTADSYLVYRLGP